jgi:hypothetical protein
VDANNLPITSLFKTVLDKADCDYIIFEPKGRRKAFSLHVSHAPFQDSLDRLQKMAADDNISVKWVYGVCIVTPEAITGQQAFPAGQILSVSLHGLRTDVAISIIAGACGGGAVYSADLPTAVISLRDRDEEKFVVWHILQKIPGNSGLWRANVMKNAGKTGGKVFVVNKPQVP